MKLAKNLASILILILLSSCSVFNSGTAHLKYTVMDATFDDIEYENSEKLSDVSASIRRVQHPKAYGKWNINVNIAPSIHFDKNRFTTDETFINEQGIVEKHPDIMLKRLSSFANLKLTTHTPIGAFVLTGGFGGTFYDLSDGRGLDTLKTREIRKLDLAYVGFFSDRFFVLVGPRYYKEAFEQFIFAFRIGFFWGDFKKN